MVYKIHKNVTIILKSSKSSREIEKLFYSRSKIKKKQNKSNSSKIPNLLNLNFPISSQISNKKKGKQY